MGIRWLKMGKMSDKITQDGGKMRKMRDVSSGLAPLGGWAPLAPATTFRAQAPGRSPLRVGNAFSKLPPNSLY